VHAQSSHAHPSAHTHRTHLLYPLASSEYHPPALHSSALPSPCTVLNLLCKSIVYHYSCLPSAVLLTREGTNDHLKSCHYSCLSVKRTRLISSPALLLPCPPLKLALPSSCPALLLPCQPPSPAIHTSTLLHARSPSTDNHEGHPLHHRHRARRRFEFHHWRF
jgi:hypothetical protein